MTAVAANYFLRVPAFRPSSNAASATAERIAKMLRDATSHSRDNATDWRPFTNALIEEIAIEHSHPNWDGYGAHPISPKAKALAQALIDLLPYTFPAPDPVADPDGELALSWDFGPGHVFTLSINQNGMLSYAGLLGEGGKKHGMEPFKGVIPEVVFESIEDLRDRSDTL
jgi:hypothetical protein